MIDVALPPGRWAVGVSGGADSVALLLLAHNNPDLQPHVVHLDHQTRGDHSTADARFVADLARRLGLPATVARRSDVEPPDVPTNPSARYRSARLALFRRVVTDHALDGVLLAHHAADQGETVLLRLLRGGGPRSLQGMAERTALGPLTVVRPLLRTDPADLRTYLRSLGQPWREDASNASDQYLRNRVRPAATAPSLGDALRDVAAAARRWVAWLDDHAPPLPAAFDTAALTAAPAPLARHAAGRWLVARGAPPDAVNRATCDRLVSMATDADAAARQTFPAGVDVVRRRGVITAASPPPAPARGPAPPPARG